MRMSLKQLLDQNKLKVHKTSKNEIASLLQMISRDINDAKIDEISSDRRFATAYNAVLQMATILLYCQGYKTRGVGHHFTVFQAMKSILGKKYYELADYFDSCRSKRNITDYIHAGGISKNEAKELILEAENFLKVIINWLKKNHPDLIE
jgi:uncharacterized protein (UPF0332 family)